MFQGTFFFLNNEDWDSDESEPGADDSIYNYDRSLLTTAWCEYTRDPFNKLTRGHWVEYITPEGCTNGKKKKIKPPYSIFWESLTSDVGPVVEKR